MKLDDLYIGSGDRTAALPPIIKAEPVAPVSTTVVLKTDEIQARHEDQAKA
jgi:hypothetical protein